jgi:hypothetical protein
VVFGILVAGAIFMYLGPAERQSHRKTSMPSGKADWCPPPNASRPRQELGAIMEILTKAFDALWQVLLVGLLLGAGLPALFALESLSQQKSPAGECRTAGEEITKPSGVGSLEPLFASVSACWRFCSESS